MAYEIKKAIIHRDNIDENFELIDPEEHFNDKKVLVAIDGDTLITVQLLINSIIKNDFKKWKKISKKDIPDSVSQLFVNLGYSREELSKLMEDLD